jgi:predicted transcriptional regulator
MAGDDAPKLPADIFMELASETRCHILLMLDEQPRRANELATKLNLTVQEAHRNTTRLMEAGIIRKSADGSFSITEYGKIITRQISYFQFLREHREVDMGTLFVSDDPMFNEWCMDLFNYTWKHSKPFDIYKTRIVES